jgi:hypothetical protein
MDLRLGRMKARCYASTLHRPDVRERTTYPKEAQAALIELAVEVVPE